MTALRSAWQNVVELARMLGVHLVSRELFVSNYLEQVGFCTNCRCECPSSGPFD